MSTNGVNDGRRSAAGLARSCVRLSGLVLLLGLTWGGTCTISATHNHPESCHGSHHHGCQHSTAAVTQEPELLLESYERSTFVDATGELVEVVRVAVGPQLPVRQLRAEVPRHGFARALLSSNARLFAGDPEGELSARGVFETPQGFLATWVREVEGENEGARAVQIPGYRLQLAFDGEGRLIEIERRRGVLGFAAALAR